MIGGALPLIIVTVGTTLSSMKVVQTNVLPSGNDYAHLVTCQRRRRVSNVFSTDLEADRNNLANLSGALVSHILSRQGDKSRRWSDLLRSEQVPPPLFQRINTENTKLGVVATRALEFPSMADSLARPEQHLRRLNPLPPRAQL
jgi:hypothetical protein